METRWLKQLGDGKLVALVVFPGVKRVTWLS